MSRHKPLAIGATAAFAVAAIAAFAQQPNDPDPTSVRTLRAQKRDLLQQRANALEQSYLTGQVAHSDVIEAKVDLIKSQLDLAADHGERLQILESQVQLYAGWEQLAESRFTIGQITHPKLLKIKAKRIDAEIALLREKQ